MSINDPIRKPRRFPKLGGFDNNIARYLKQKTILRKPESGITLYLQQKVRSLRSLRQFKGTIGLIQQLDFSEEELQENAALLRRFDGLTNLDIRTVNWFVEYFERAYAGIFNILRFAEYFQKVNGVENRLIIYNHPGADAVEIKARMTKAFPGLCDAQVIVLRDPSLNTVPASDIAIATHWTSAYSVLRFKETKGKFYFIQDYEPLFYPAGSLYGLAEATYRFGFYGIVNTPGLWEAVRSELRAPSKYFLPAIDYHVFYPPKRREASTPFRLFFYGRPEVSRNAFEIGFLAIERLKRKWGEKLEVYVAGSPASLVLKSCNQLVHNLGFLPYAETGNLYRRCDAGLVFMLTKHPSYIPYELMGCGAVVVSNRNPANEWLLRDQENCLLCEPVPSQVAQAVSSLISDPALTEKLGKKGLETVSGLSWEREMQGIFDFIARREQGAVP